MKEKLHWIKLIACFLALRIWKSVKTSIVCLPDVRVKWSVTTCQCYFVQFGWTWSHLSFSLTPVFIDAFLHNLCLLKRCPKKMWKLTLLLFRIDCEMLGSHTNKLYTPFRGALSCWAALLSMHQFLSLALSSEEVLMSLSLRDQLSALHGNGNGVFDHNCKYKLPILKAKMSESLF